MHFWLNATPKFWQAFHALLPACDLFILVFHWELGKDIVIRVVCITLSVTSFGIVGTLLEGGQDSPCCLKAIPQPYPCRNTLMQHLKTKQQVLQDYNLIVGDESTLAHKGILRHNITIREIKGNDGWWGEYCTPGWRLQKDSYSSAKLTRLRYASRCQTLFERTWRPTWNVMIVITIKIPSFLMKFLASNSALFFSCLDLIMAGSENQDQAYKQRQRASTIFVDPFLRTFSLFSCPFQYLTSPNSEMKNITLYHDYHYTYSASGWLASTQENLATVTSADSPTYYSWNQNAPVVTTPAFHSKRPWTDEVILRSQHLS